MPRFNRAYRGLYANRMIQFGNKISFAENKTRRTWKPNVQNKSMYSETLGRMLRFRMTTHAMRCIRKAGGIEEYLLKAKESEIKYPRALRFKQEIIAVRAARKAAAEDMDKDKPDASNRSEGHVRHATGTAQTASVPSPLVGTAPAKARCYGLKEILWF